MNRPYVSRRSRRCAAGALCVHGGRIRPGEVVVRGKQHLYVHSDDDQSLDRVLEAISALTAKLPAWFRQLNEAILTTGQALARVFAGPVAWQQHDDQLDAMRYVYPYAYPPLNVGIVRDSVLNTRNDVEMLTERLSVAAANDHFLMATTNLATPEAIQRAREHYTRPLRWVPPIEPVYDFVPLPDEPSAYLLGGADPGNYSFTVESLATLGLLDRPSGVSGGEMGAESDGSGGADDPPIGGGGDPPPSGDDDPPLARRGAA